MSRLIDADFPISKMDSWKKLTDKEKLHVAEFIVSMPTVEERKHGYWIINHPSSLMPYRCSDCNKDSAVHGNYCPECGAIMDE